MKTIIAISFLITASLFSEQTMAGGNFKVNVAPKSENKALMEISNIIEQKYEISLSNFSGEILYRHKTRGEHSKLSKVFDFSNSEYGIYKLLVERSGGSNEQLITFSKNGIQVSEIINKSDPFFRYENNMLMLSFLNLNNEETSLNIYNNENLIFEKKLNVYLNLKNKFDLSKLDKGNYQVVLSSGNDLYEYNLTRE